MVAALLTLGLSIAYNIALVDAKPCYKEGEKIIIKGMICNESEINVFVDKRLENDVTCRSSFRKAQTIKTSGKELYNTLENCADGDYLEKMAFSDLKLLKKSQCIAKEFIYETELLNIGLEKDRIFSEKGYGLRLLFSSDLSTDRQENLENINNLFHGELWSNEVIIKICK